MQSSWLTVAILSGNFYNDLGGCKVLITGAASGIEAAIAELAVKRGAFAILADQNALAATALADRIGNAAAVQLDVTDEASIAALCTKLRARGKVPDALINSAGIWEMAPLLAADRASFRRLFAVNVEGMFFTLQAVAQLMIESGKRGAIVNLASQAGRRGEADSAVYAASKAAVISLTQAAAISLIGSNIRVNAVAPGNIDTPMWNKVDLAFVSYSPTLGQFSG